MYFCGNSLGLPPAKASVYVQEVMDEWAARGVHGHREGPAPWFPYHELFRETGARLVGAQPGEVVMMNSLTVNLHLLLTTFYRPEGKRRKILMESPAFPSDIYCLQSHVESRGLDPQDVLVKCPPPPGDDCLSTSDLLDAIDEHGKEWRKVAEYVGTRDYKQVQSYCKSLVKKLYCNPELRGAHLLPVLEIKRLPGN